VYTFWLNLFFKGYSTSSYDSNKLTNNHSVKLQNEELALIENFIKIEHKIHVIIRVLQKENIKFKIKQRNYDVEEALLKINTFFSFYNITKIYCLIPIEVLKEKIIICESSMYSKAKFYATEIVVAHNKL
jgi:hypothetical protein